MASDEPGANSTEITLWTAQMMEEERPVPASEPTSATSSEAPRDPPLRRAREALAEESEVLEQVIEQKVLKLDRLRREAERRSEHIMRVANDLRELKSRLDHVTQALLSVDAVIGGKGNGIEDSDD